MRTDVPRSPNQPFAGRVPGRVTALIDSAADMFLQHGFEAVSLDDLIARVGGSRRNIYSHFGGKEGLFLATVTSLCEDLAVPLKALHIPRTGDPAEVLRLFGRELLTIVLLPRTLALHRLMIAEAVRFPQLAHTIWEAGHSRAASILADWIAYQQTAGLLRKERAASAAAQDFVDLVVADAQLRALTSAGRPATASQRDRIVAAATDTFLHGHVAPGQ